MTEQPFTPNRLRRILLFVFALAVAASLSNCAGLHPSANMGLNMHFGPHGPMIDPYVNVGLSTGGGCCW
jgi:hypothetical protein